MSDLSDVENSLVAVAAQAIYPNGTGQTSAIGAPAKIYRGWPIPSSLDADLEAGLVNVSVFPIDIEKRTTRFLTNWQPLPLPFVALTVAVTATTVTLGGTPSSPLNVGVIVNGHAFLYAIQPNDTLTSIATALASLINTFTPATNSGPIITIPGATQMAARTGATATVTNEVRRQKRNLMISCWCSTPQIRDATCSIVDAAFATVDYLTLPDGYAARILYERSQVMDQVQKPMIYRRNLIYSVEYATTQAQTSAQIVTQLFNLTGGLDPSTPAIISFNS